MVKTGTLSLSKAAKSSKAAKPTVEKSNTAGYKIKRKTNKQRSSTSAAAFANERHGMIAETAYYQAEKRGFQPGHEILDWLEAEKEVDKLLGKAANRVAT